MKRQTAISSICIAALLLSLVFSFFPSGKVLAADATLTINPTPATVAWNGTSTINVVINNVTNLYGYDIELSFDPNIIQVVSVSNGGFLSLGTQDGPYIDNVNGIISYSNAQRNPAQPQTGTGTLISILVQGVNVGQSPIRFETDSPFATLSDRNGISIPFTFTNGTIYVYNPTAITLDSFTATAARKSIALDWKTTNEQNNLGFNIYRSTSETGLKVKLNKNLIPTNVPPGSNIGASYEFVDTSKDLKNKTTYYYWLEALDLHGNSRYYGPVSALFWQSAAR